MEFEFCATVTMTSLQAGIARDYWQKKVDDAAEIIDDLLMDPPVRWHVVDRMLDRILEFVEMRDYFKIDE